MAHLKHLEFKVYRTILIPSMFFVDINLARKTGTYSSATVRIDSVISHVVETISQTLSDVRCTIYKELQRALLSSRVDEYTLPPPRVDEYTLPDQHKRALHTQTGITYAQISKQNSYAPTDIHRSRATDRSKSSPNKR